MKKPQLNSQDQALDVDASAAEEADTLFNTLLHEAINIPGDHGIQHKDIPISTSETDLRKLRKGRAFFHRNYYACAWTIVFTELVQYPIQRITSFVLRNENYNGPAFAYLRGVVTFTHVLEWFGPEIENKAAQSAQDACKVRKIHESAVKRLSQLPVPPPNTPKKDRSHVLEAIRKDLEHIPTPEYLPSIMTRHPKVPISQFDLAMVLGVFYFLLDVNPRSVGLYTEKDYESYIYYVGIIGRYLGLEDRFNLPLHPNPDVRKAVSRRFLEEIITPCFKNFDEHEFHNLCYFAENAFYLESFEVGMFMMIKDVLGLPAPNTYRHVNCTYRFLYKCLRSTYFLVRFAPLLYIGNKCLRLWHWAGLMFTRDTRRNLDNCNVPLSTSTSCNDSSKIGCPM